MYYPSRENKGADQVCSYCTADLRLCFRICKFPVFSSGSSIADLFFSRFRLERMWFILRPVVPLFCLMLEVHVQQLRSCLDGVIS